jgi:hypothetical protein
MNIIKFKDNIMPDEYAISEFFNKHLKGKYAYWIQMRYAIPLDSLDFNTYTIYEQMNDFNSQELDIEYIDLKNNELDFVRAYIDMSETDNANNISYYKYCNNYITDIDIDINSLRNFRSWLASEILKFINTVDTNTMTLSANQMHMLEYYKNGMYNDIVKYLSVFGIDNIFTISNTSSCCCNSIDPLITLNQNTCNALNIYTNNIHALMVQTFTDIEFWKRFNKEFIVTFKKYIDNIIKAGLVISTDNIKETAFIKCNCSNSSVNATNEMLKNLSEALQYIINNETTGHQNFIYDSLYNWADQLYDHMSWIVK